MAIRVPAPAGAELPKPPSVREVATRSVDGGREKRERGGSGHPPLRTVYRWSFRRGRCPHRPVCHGSAAASSLPCVKAAQCSHWVVRRSVAEVSRQSRDGGIVKKGHSAPRRGVRLPSAAKVPKTAVQTCGLKIPCAASPVVYPACFHHANAVPCKFRLNVASSLLLFSLPLLL